MALKNEDLFLVTIDEDPGFVDKKITFGKLKQELGVRLAVEETTTSNGLVTPGIPGYMYPDASFDYNRATGRLSVPLDARGVTFIGLIDSSNKDTLPDGSEKTGEFYICDEADLEVSTSKWLGIEGGGGGITADPAEQVLTSGGGGYFPNNGAIAVTGLKTGNNPSLEVGTIDLTIEDGKIIAAQHNPTSIDVPSLNLAGGLYEFINNNSFGYDEPAVVEVLGVVELAGEYIINFNIISQGLGYRDENNGGALTGARAVPVSGDEEKSFEVDLTVNALGNVTAITGVRLTPGHESDDEFYIALPYNKTPGTLANFTLKLEGEETVTLQLNDKLIKRGDGQWAILTDQLANQAVISITNEEGDIDGQGTIGDLTPALKIKNLGGDPKYVTIAIDEVTSDNPGLMPPGLFDQINGYPDYIAGGTVVDLVVNVETAIDPLSDGSYHESETVNPVRVQDLTIKDDNDEDIEPDVIKNVEVNVERARILDVGGDFTRVRGTVYITNPDEIVAAFIRGGNDHGPQEEYDRVVNADLAGHHLMPRNLEYLDQRGEEYRTAKRLKVTTTKYELDPEDTSFADLTATLTYEDGTEVVDNTTYSFSWEGVQYIGGDTAPIGDDSATVRVLGDDFEGPTNITCTVTESTVDADDGITTEFQTLKDSVYLHFGGGASGPIDPIEPEKPTFGSLLLTGPSEVILERDTNLNLHTYIATITNAEANDHQYTFTSSDETVAKLLGTRGTTSEEAMFEFIGEGQVRIEVVVTSETAEESQSAFIDVTVKPFEVNLPTLTLRDYDFDDDNLSCKIEHILSDGQYDFDITYTLECDTPGVTITPITTSRVSSQEHTFDVTVPQPGSYTFKGTAYPTDDPQYVVEAEHTVSWTADVPDPVGSYIRFKAFCLANGDTAKAKVYLTPQAEVKRLNKDTNQWEVVGTVGSFVVNNPGTKDEYSEWLIDSTNLTNFKFEKVNGTGSYPELVFDLTSSTPSLTSLEQSFKSFDQQRGNRRFDLSWVNTSNVTNMKNAFGSSRFTKNDLNIGGWDVSKVRTLEYAFKASVVKADIRSWNISSVTNMNETFFQAGASSGINYWNPENSATKWNFSNVTTMRQCWYGVKNPFFNWDQATVESWDLGNVTNVSQMFWFNDYVEERMPLPFAIQYNVWCAEKMNHNNNRGQSGFHNWWSKTYEYDKPNNQLDPVLPDQMPQWLQPCS